jgi:hypothetical protein
LKPCTEHFPSYVALDHRFSDMIVYWLL